MCIITHTLHTFITLVILTIVDNTFVIANVLVVAFVVINTNIILILILITLRVCLE